MTDYGNHEREDEVFLVVTVLKTKNNYVLRMKEPGNLAPNQVCHRIKFTMDKRDWFNRISDVSPDLTKLKPPGAPKIYMEETVYGKTTGEKVMDRMQNR